jgi:hypothetical protein
MTTATQETTTRTIAGHEFTLIAGRRYLASRPMASRKGERFDVKVTDTTDGFFFGAEPEAIVPGLGYDAANRLIEAFNDGETSFEGRIW